MSETKTIFVNSNITVLTIANGKSLTIKITNFSRRISLIEHEDSMEKSHFLVLSKKKYIYTDEIQKKNKIYLTFIKK